MKNLLKTLAVVGIIVGVLAAVKLSLEILGSGVKEYIKIDRNSVQ